MPFSNLGVSLLGERYCENWAGKGQGQGCLSLSFGFRGEQLELLLGKGNSLLPLEPSPELLLLPWGEPLLVRAASELGPY